MPINHIDTPLSSDMLLGKIFTITQNGAKKESASRQLNCLTLRKLTLQKCVL